MISRRRPRSRPKVLSRASSHTRLVTPTELRSPGALRGFVAFGRNLCRLRPGMLPNLVFNVDAVLRPPLHSNAPTFAQRPRPVNKHDLIAAVAASTNLSKVDAANAVDAILTVITKSLKKK